MLTSAQSSAIKAWIAIAPLIGATLIAVSRTMGAVIALSFLRNLEIPETDPAPLRPDYRHHATDVIAGSILGALIALVTYHLCTTTL